MLVGIFIVLLITLTAGWAAIAAHRQFNAWGSPIHCYGAGMAIALSEYTAFDGPWWLALAGGIAIGGVLHNLGRSSTTATELPSQPEPAPEAAGGDAQAEKPGRA